MRRQLHRSLSELKTQLRMIGATTYQLQKPEIPVLCNTLFPHEKVHAFILGFYESGYGMLVGTDLRMLFIDKMFFGQKVEDIPYSMIGTIEYDMGIFFGKVKIVARTQLTFSWVKKSNLLNFYEYIDLQMLSRQKAKS